MKLGINWIVLAISCLTLASGCTKNNSSKKTPKNAAPIETGTDSAATAVDPKNEGTDTGNDETLAIPPVLTPSSAQTGTETSTPTTGDTSSFSENSNTSSKATTSATESSTTSQPASPVAQPKSELGTFESCVSTSIKDLISKEREKNQDLIKARKLHETKVAVVKKCARPDSVPKTTADSLINKNITDVVNAKFLKGEEELEIFLEMENSDFNDDLKAQLYDEWEKMEVSGENTSANSPAAIPVAAPTSQTPRAAVPQEKKATPSQATTATVATAAIPMPKGKVPSLSSALATPAPPPAKAEKAQSTPAVAITESSTDVPNPSAPVKAQASTATTATQTVKPVDLPSYEKCVTALTETILTEVKKKVSEIEHPGQIGAIVNLLQEQCAFQGTSEAHAILAKVVSTKVLSYFPKSKDILDFYTLIMKSSYSDNVKYILLSYYNVQTDLKFNNTKLSGVIDPAHTVGNNITYKIIQLGGTVQRVRHLPNGAANTTSESLDKATVENVFFAFDVNLNTSNVGKLTIFEGTTSHALDYAFVKGDPAQLKAGQSVTVAFSPESWKRIMEAKVRHTIGLLKQEAPIFPIKYTVQNQNEQQSRLCELTAKDLKCTDTNSIVTFKVTKETLILK